MGYEDRIVAPDGFDGPVKKRRVTDPLWLLLLIGSWVGLTSLGSWSLQNGNISDLIQQRDYLGRRCGVDTDPQTGEVLPSKRAIVDFLLNGICVDECPDTTDTDVLICKDEETIAALEGCAAAGADPNDPEDSDLLILCGACMYSIESREVVEGYCVPAEVGIVARELNATLYSYFGEDAEGDAFEMPNYEHLDAAYQYTERFVKDLMLTWRVVLGIGVGGAIFCGFIFLLIARLPLFIASIFWSIALSFPFLFFGLGYGLVNLEVTQADLEFQDVVEDSETAMRYADVAGYVCYGLAATAAVLLCYMRRRIALAIGVTRAAARSVAAVPLSVVYPLFQLCGLVLFMVPWTYYLLTLASTGEVTTVVTKFYGFEMEYNVYVYSQEAKYGFWYLLFCLFWTSQFIIAVGDIVLAMCYSKWYFTEDKSGLMLGVNVFSTTVTTLCYHAGTAAFGSLIVAAIQWLRAVVMYVQKQMEKAGPDGKIVKAVACCCQCCLACLEKCMKFISKNAYIQTAIFGHSFCHGAAAAFYLILRNAARMAAVGLVSELTTILCKLFVVLACAAGSFYAIDGYYGDEVSSIDALVLFVGALAWFLADMFTDVLGVAVATILQCFVADEEMFGGQGSRFVPTEMEDFLTKLDGTQEERRVLTAVPVED